MFYLIWEMGILLLLAVGFGVFVGYQLWSGDARSAEADAAIAENARLRQENENLARRLGEAEAQARVAAPDPTPARVEAPEIAMPEAVVREAVAAAPVAPKPKAAARTVRPKPVSDAKPAAKPAAKPKADPKPTAKSSKPAAATGDDLGAIKGLGPKAAAALNAGGVTSLAQVAAWTEADIERWDTAINGRGRIVRDDWVGQAKKLAG